MKRSAMKSVIKNVLAGNMFKTSDVLSEEILTLIEGLGMEPPKIKIQKTKYSPTDSEAPKPVFEYENQWEKE